MMMKHKVRIETHTEEDMKFVKSFIKNFNFDKIIPMPKSLNIDDSMNLVIASQGRILWIDHILEKFPDTNTILSDQYLLNIVVPHNGLSKNEVRMLYDKRVKLARKLVRSYPVIKPDDLLHPYGQESKDKSYMFGDRVEPKCQADILYIGKVTLENLVKYGAFSKSDWIDKNWGSENSTKRSFTKINPCCYEWKFKTRTTIMPLLYYIDKALEYIEMRISYTYANAYNSITIVKPFDSKYYGGYL